MSKERSDTNQVTPAFLAELVWLLLDPLLDACGVISGHIARICGQEKDLL